MFVNASNCRAEYFNIYDTLTSLQVYLATAPPLHRWVPLWCVCVLFGFLLYSWHDDGNWSVGLVNQCQPGWADCIWWSCSDQMASWHKGLNWRGVRVNVIVCVLRRVKWVWIAISSVSSLRRIYWNSTHIHTETVGLAQGPLDQIDLWHIEVICGIQWFSRTFKYFFRSMKVQTKCSRPVVQVM